MKKTEKKQEKEANFSGRIGGPFPIGKMIQVLDYLHLKPKTAKVF
jgi:hypothetical protein